MKTNTNKLIAAILFFNCLLALGLSLLPGFDDFYHILFWVTTGSFAIFVRGGWFGDVK